MATKIGKSLFFVFCFWLSCSHSTTFLFDLDGVLIKHNRFSMLWNIGISKLYGMYNPLSLPDKLIEFLHEIEPRTSDTAQAMHRGKLMPQIMCDWQCGKKTARECRKLVEKGLLEHTNLFYSEAQRSAIGSIAEFMFTPEKFGNCFSPVKNGIKLLKKIKNSTDKNGLPHKIYIISNFDAESFPYLVEATNMHKIFSRCDGVVISGHAGCMKPDHAIFKHAFEKFDINPEKEDVVFIDDRAENIASARELGIDAILCNKLNLKPVVKELKIHNYL